MYRSLVIPLDGSTFAEQALSAAGEIAERSKASLTLLRVHRPLRYGDEATTGERDGDVRDGEREYLDRAAQSMRDHYGAKVDMYLLEEPVIGSLCDYVRAHAVDLIVMSTHGRTGVSRAWLGSVTDGIVRRVSVPVLMLRPRADSALSSSSGESSDRLFDRVLLPLDGSHLSEAIVGHAARLARTFGSEVILFRVVEPVISKGPEYPLSSPIPITLVDRDTTEQLKEVARKYLDDVAHRLRDEYGLRVTVDVRMLESAAPAIIDAVASHGANIVALSTHGRGASRLFVGSVADKVLRGGPSAVLLFRPQQD